MDCRKRCIRLSPDDTAPWTDTTTIVRRADAHHTAAELKDRPGKDILMFGSRTLWNDLVVAGLVDQLHLMVDAAVLGGGTPTFGAGPVPPLRLVNTRRRDGSDNLLLHYSVASRDASSPDGHIWRTAVAHPERLIERHSRSVTHRDPPAGGPNRDQVRARRSGPPLEAGIDRADCRCEPCPVISADRR